VLKYNHRKASQSARSARRGELVSSSKAQEVERRTCQEGTRKSFEGRRRTETLGYLSEENIRRDRAFAHKILAERSRRARHFEVRVTDKLEKR
jgi:hypothetical protein